MAGKFYLRGSRIFHKPFLTTEERQRILSLRLARQIGWEDTVRKVFWYEIDEGEDGRAWRAHRRKLQRLGVRYKSIPQPDHRIMILTDDPGRGRPVPTDLAERQAFLLDLIRNVPPGRKISGSRGFGGLFYGSRVKSLGDCIDLGFSSLADLVAWLESHGFPYELSQNDVFPDVIIRPEDRERIIQLAKERRETFDMSKRGV